MSIRLVTIGATALLALSLGACSGMSSRETSTATGAVIGGAAVGGVIGNRVDAEKHK